jgi:hypothetical protein
MRSRRSIALGAAILLGSLLVAVSPAAADTPSLQTRVSGQGVAAGAIDPVTVVSFDNRATWQPAYVIGGYGAHPFDGWGLSEGTSHDARWINCTSSFDGCVLQSEWYRTFIVLPDRPDLSLTFNVVADNFATPYMNGVLAGPRIETAGRVVIDPTLLHPGLNTFDMYFEDVGGLAGFKWDLTGTLDAAANLDENHDGIPDNTNPTVGISGVTDGATYELGAVPPASCTVADAEDGPQSVAPTTSAVTGPHAAFGVGSRTSTCAYTDQGGLAISASATYTIADRIWPTLTGAATTAPNDAGWYNGPVVIDWTAADVGAGLDPATVPGNTTINGEGSAIVASASVADHAGNTTTASSPPVAIDRTAPSTGIAAPAGWRNTTVAVTLSPSDNLSGVASTTYRIDGGDLETGTALTLTGEGDHLVEFSSTDRAGNTETLNRVHVLIDLTAPTITHALSPSPNGAAWNRTPVTVTFTCGDALSGLASCTAPSTTSDDGTTIIRGDAVDNAGNSASDNAVVNLDQAAPTITGSVPTPNGAGWYSDHLTVAWTCADTGGSGVASCPSPISLGDGTDMSVTGNVADLAGNSSSSSVHGVNIDTVRPTITGTPTTEPNADGWYAGDVVIHWTCNDERSGVVTCPADSTITGEGTDLGASAVVRDTAGNIGEAAVSGIKIDRTNPTITASRTAANAEGWNDAPVVVTFQCGDDRSGVASCPSPVTVATAGSDQEVVGSVTDHAGNTESVTITAINIDLTDPETTSSTNGAVFNSDQWAKAPVTVSLSATDDRSGVDATYFTLDGGSLSLYSGPLTLGDGVHTLEFSSVDNAGNSEPSNTQVIKVDTTKPVVAYTGATSYTVDQTVALTCTPSDSLSGVRTSTCAAVSGTADTFATGDNTRSATATDNAGNVGSGSVTFRVSATFDSLCNLSVRYADGTLGNSLCAKLAAAEASAARGNTKAKGNQLDAYRSEVKAQSGKKLTATEAATLTRLSLLL